MFDPEALITAFNAADAVVNLLTHIPTAETFAEPGAWDENDRLRTEASAVVARAAQAAGVARLIQESLAFVYADGGDDWLDEDAPVRATGTTETALVAETNARQLFRGETVVLRFGLFVGPDSHLTQTDIQAARTGISPSLGRRSAYRATVWLDDAAPRWPARSPRRPASTTWPTPTHRRAPRSTPRSLLPSVADHCVRRSTRYRPRSR